jgi:fructose-bisphosphate aldolase, class II
MNTLHEVLAEAARREIAVGHFNVSDLVALQAIVTSARALHVPVLIGVSEGEREFLGASCGLAPRPRGGAGQCPRRSDPV